MLRKIEQAITNVLTAKQTPDYYDVMNAYFRLCAGSISPVSMIEANSFFERAMDKYPDVGEKVGFQAPFAELIADFRKSQWKLSINIATGIMGQRFPCPCCGIPANVDDIRRKLGLLDDMEIEVLPPAKSKKSRRRISNKTKSKKSNGKTLAFDLYGPSTSALSM